MNPRWYKNAVVYSLDVRTFQDSDGDGIGDFDGLSSRLDYLSTLGVTAIWLKPMFPSPYRDGGYDVTDYTTVAEELGGLPSFVAFLEQARENGLRVIIDLPINHTSVEHPWFREARSNRKSAYRDFYIWADEPPADSPDQIVFRGDQPDPWTYDDAAGAHYLHRFYADEPDLNHANPEVRAEVLRILTFWLRLGVAGVRIDAAPYISKKAAADPRLHGTHPFLVEMHERVTGERPDAMLMAEADVKPAELSGYFTDGRGMQMLFDFLINNYFFLSLARQEAEPLTKVLGVLPRRPAAGQWANWVRNHDELDLERLTSHERDDVMAAFAPDDEMRIYGRGIRRRLPPMVDGDRRRMELVYSLMFALPGTPILRYGEEIGMGDDLSLVERNSVRTPMQWTAEVNAGFSTAKRDDLILPVIAEGRFGYREVNVEREHVGRDSFLARMHLLIAVRRQTAEIGWEEPNIVDTGHRAVLGLTYGEDEPLLVLHNLGREHARVTMRSLAALDHLHDVLADQPYEPIENLGTELELGPYGYRWSRLSARRGGEGREARAATEAMRDRPT